MKTYKRRVQLIKKRIINIVHKMLLTNLLPVLDNFERALAVEAKTEEASFFNEGSRYGLPYIC